MHEIRNPLGAIRLQVGVLRRKFPDGEVPEIEAIDEETHRLELLVRRISEFLKNPAGSPTRIDLASFIADFASKRPEGLKIKAIQEGAVVSFDPELLRSVMENLVRNALESYPDEARDKEADISLAIQGEAAVVTVGDRGRGITDALRGKIFDPFFTTNRAGISARIRHRPAARRQTLRGSGGRRPQAGIAQGRRNRGEDHNPARGEKMKILIADDREEHPQFHRASLLASEGIESSTANDGLSARALLESESFDGMITDLRMPGMGGLELRSPG